MDLNHLNLRVRDPAACREFYEQRFGFRLAFEQDEASFLKNDDGFLLVVSPADPHQDLPDGFHIGFGLDSAEEVVLVHRQLTSVGVAATDVQDFRPEESFVTFRCHDPDGTEIEVFWENERRPAPAIGSRRRRPRVSRLPGRG